MAQILDILKNLTDNHYDEVEEWFAKARSVAEPYFYTSVDLRHSGVRLAPVDTNLFPAGFNNLSPAAQARASLYITRYLQDHYPEAKKALIIPENHTRNLAYFDSLAVLTSLLEKAGMETKIGSLVAQEPLKFTSALGNEIEQFPLLKTAPSLRASSVSAAIHRNDEWITTSATPPRNDKSLLSLTGDYTPDLIILNNDLTPGIPEILQNVAQPIIPPMNMGWFRRRKSVHFAAYKKLAQDFAENFGLDPWLISASSHQCGMVDFKDKNSMECLAESIEEILVESRKKHKEYAIESEPYIYIKADSGTYGMGIMTVKSASEVLDLNKKERNKMSVIKEGAQVSEVIIQEGIETIDTIDGFPAEPMVYMIDGIPTGGMYRFNGQRDAQNNLNAAGMSFTGMCDESEDELGRWKKIKNCNFHSHGLIASIAALAAAREEY